MTETYQMLVEAFGDEDLNNPIGQTTNEPGRGCSRWQVDGTANLLCPME